MKIQGSDIVIQHDPLSYATGYVFLQGSPHQTYDTQSMQYDPSRAVVPLVIMPWVSVNDPNGEYSGQCNLNSVTAIYRKMVNGAWVDVNIDGSEPTKYFISDGTTQQGVTAPRGAVVFLMNVPPAEVSAIIITANVVDPLDGLLKAWENTVDLQTKTATTTQYTLRVDDGVVANGSFDPRDVQKTNGKRLLTLAVQLYADNVEVADADAVYFWYHFVNGQYIPITDDDQLWLRTPFLDNTTHELPNVIQVELDHFDQLRLMVSASPIGDTRPTEPDFLHGAERIYFDYKRVCRKDVEGFVIGDVGIKLIDNEDIQRSILLRDKNGDIANAAVDEHFRIDWYLRNNNSSSYVSRGRSIAGKARTDFRATHNNVTTLMPKVYFMKCWKAIMFNNKYLVDGSGKVVTGQDYIQI